MEILVIVCVLFFAAVCASTLWLFSDDEDAGYEQGAKYKWVDGSHHPWI